MSDEARTVIKARIATIAAVKLVTSILTLYYFPSWHALVVVVGLSVPWVVGGIYYAVRSSWLGYRIWRFRQFRKRLIREEWEVEDVAEVEIDWQRNRR